MSNESEDIEDISYLLWNLQIENNENTVLSYSTNSEETNSQINVILSGNSMVSEFPPNIDGYATKCLFGSGASHTCMSYRCFKSIFPLTIPTEA